MHSFNSCANDTAPFVMEQGSRLLRQDASDALLYQTAIAELCHCAVTEANYQNLLKMAVAEVQANLNVDYCGILEVLPADSLLVLRVSAGWEPGLRNRANVPAGTRSPSGYALLHNQSIAFDDLQDEARFQTPFLYRTHGIVSGAVIPISGRPGSSYGVLHALSRTKRRFTKSELYFLEIVTNIVAGGIQRSFLEKEVLKIAEAERQRIGQDLHDTVCQELTGAGLFAKRLQQALKQKGSSESTGARELVGIISRAAAQVRNITRELTFRHLSGQRITYALRAVVQDVQKRSAISCHCRIGKGTGIADGFTAYQFLRIAQEAVNNAVKHSCAKHLWLSLIADGDFIQLTIEDDGIGLSNRAQAHKGIGLHTMTSRARSIDALLSVGPRSGGGVIVECKVCLATPR